MCKWFSMPICFLFRLLRSFPSVCLLCPTLIWLLWLFFSFLFLYYIPLKTCFFSNERQKGADPNGRGGGNKLEGVEGRKNGNHGILYENNLFSINEKSNTQTALVLHCDLLSNN